LARPPSRPAALSKAPSFAELSGARSWLHQFNVEFSPVRFPNGVPKR
jgi:hypothetical protein